MTPADVQICFQHLPPPKSFKERKKLSKAFFAELENAERYYRLYVDERGVVGARSFYRFLLTLVGKQRVHLYPYDRVANEETELI
eukprot:CAMPEP_0196587476 /NCGR_PEP_ID=MMETSP1081-20130531/57594_1 /TAXON_ID=36882 /ORGANISM="Pyramimonas amylifera, Strain CCMP720" /LENGTH=84 /DNA_ID=CAMNT_0041909669 /DNA_START=46 /DNA_END=297 /DNA_ORIENTATION=+